MCCIKWTHKLNLFPLSRSNQSGLESIPSGETRQHFDVACRPGKSLTLTSLIISSFPVTKICNKKVTWFFFCEYDEVFCSNPFGDPLHWAKYFEVCYVFFFLLQNWQHSNQWRTWALSEISSSALPKSFSLRRLCFYYKRHKKKNLRYFAAIIFVKLGSSIRALNCNIAE